MSLLYKKLIAKYLHYRTIFFADTTQKGTIVLFYFFILINETFEKNN